MWCTTLHQGQFHRFLFFCYVLLCYVLWCDVPPFTKVNSIDSYSFVMYCYVMYWYVIYHPSSRSIPPLLILLLCIVMLCIVRSRTTLHHSQFHQVKVIRNSKYCFPTSFDYIIYILYYIVLSYIILSYIILYYITVYSARMNQSLAHSIRCFLGALQHVHALAWPAQKLRKQHRPTAGQEHVWHTVTYVYLLNLSKDLANVFFQCWIMPAA